MTTPRLLSLVALIFLGIGAATTWYLQVALPQGVGLGSRSLQAAERTIPSHALPNRSRTLPRAQHWTPSSVGSGHSATTLCSGPIPTVAQPDQSSTTATVAIPSAGAWMPESASDS